MVKEKTKMADLVKYDEMNFNVPTGNICTIDLSDLEGTIKLATALNGSVSMKDKVGEILRVTDIVTVPGVRSRTGEACTNTHLICDDGTVYFTQSDGIARSVKVLLAAFTDKQTGRFISPVSRGVGFKVMEQKLDNGNTLKTMIPAKFEEATTA
jgi:hypothetical protein